MKKSWKRNLLFIVAGTAVLTAGRDAVGADSQVVQIDMVQYRTKAVDISEEPGEKFNAARDNIRLNVDFPNDAMIILKIRFIRKGVPDIIGIGEEVNYPSFLDSNILMNLDDCEGLSTINESHSRVDEELELVPKDGVYAVPYVANVAGVLYNKDLFEEHGWAAPITWDEFTALCKQIQGGGVLPVFFGFKDTWNCLTLWNATSVDLAPSNVCSLVNKGETIFTEQYREMTEWTLVPLKFAREDPSSYGYSGACTVFTRGESAMFVIGSYAVPQIQSVNPGINIDTFVLPASNQAEENVSSSGIDLQFCVMADSPSEEAAYKMLDFPLQDENVQLCLDNQNAAPYKNGDFTLSGVLDGMTSYIREGRVADYQDHHYPTEMSVDAMIQTCLMDENTDVFLEKLDRGWQRYNRGLIIKVQNYEGERKKKVSEGGEEDD